MTPALPAERPPAADEPRTLAVLRRFLLVVVALAAIGTGLELALIGHYEDPWQFVPLAILAAIVVVAAWHAIAPRAITVRVMQGVMLLSLASGGVGMALHYQGNEEFELEMYPSMTGRELFTKTITGATPVLAPGTMALIGLIGLAITYRHPRLRGQARED